MPRLPELVQEPFALYPEIEELDKVRGVITAELDILPDVEPEQRITLGRLATSYGHRLGMYGDLFHPDPLAYFEVTEEDFKQAEPEAIKHGLYINRSDKRFKDDRTEQLITVVPAGQPMQPGVVFPAEDFHVVARNPKDFAKHVMSKTRKANAANPDRIDAGGRTGRSPAHALKNKIKAMNAIEKVLISDRENLLVPLYNETLSPWQSHFKAKNLDKKRKAFDEQLHHTVETASLNLDLGSAAVKAAHRAIALNLYSRGSGAEINGQWQRYIDMMRLYVMARRAKVVASRHESVQTLKEYQPFLDAKNGAAAA